MIRNVIFDLDGTLLDTREGIVESARYAAKTLGYPELPRETMLSFIGPPIQQSFMTHYGCDPHTAQEAANLFRTYYKEKALLKAVPYAGIYDLCGTLKSWGINMAVATYKREDYALTLLRHFHFHEYCAVMHGADGDNRLKKRDIIQLCLQELTALRAESVLVGDTVQDAAGAEEAGIPFLAVTYGFGFHGEKDIAGFAHIGTAQEPGDIADVLGSYR